jgi:hypothetical protein
MYTLCVHGLRDLFNYKKIEKTCQIDNFRTSELQRNNTFFKDPNVFTRTLTLHIFGEL